MSIQINGTTGISGVAGSVSAPMLTGDDANCGISFPAADTIKFSTGGVERMQITDSGVSGTGLGKILQVVSTTKTDTSSMTGETPTDIAGFTVTITPSSTSSKIMIFACINHGGTSAGYPGFNLFRGTTEICKGTYGTGSNRNLTTGASNVDSYKLTSSILHFLDSPNTTSAITYKVQMSTYGSQVVWINRPLSVSSSYNYTMGTTSTITAQEVAA